MHRGVTEVAELEPFVRHQATRDGFAFEDLLLELFNCQSIEVGMRVSVIAQRHPCIQPLLQQIDACSRFRSSQVDLIDKADRRRAMLP